MPASQQMVLRIGTLLAQAENAFRITGAFLYGCYAWLVFVPLLLLFGILATLAGSVALARRLARRFARAMFRLAGMPLSVTGLEHLPAAPHVLLVNHTSFLDAIVLTALLPTSPGYAFIARQQYALQALLWPFLRSVHTLVLHRHPDLHHAANLELMQRALEHGENLVVFPEGGFSPEPGLKQFHSGAFVAAAHAHVPIAMAGLRGTRDALRLGTWLPRRLPLTLEIGPTLIPGDSDPAAIHAQVAAAHAAMIPLAGEGICSTRW